MKPYRIHHQFLLLSSALAVVLLAGWNITKVSANGVNSRPKPDPTVQAPPAQPVYRPVTVPQGAVVSIRTLTTMSTRNLRAGDAVAATLEAPLVSSGVVLAPRGADVMLLVADSNPGGRIKGRSHLGLRLVSIQVAGGNRSVLTTVAWRQARGTKKRDAIRIGAFTGGGATIGAMAAGGVGAAIGAGAGAGTGAVVVLATRELRRWCRRRACCSSGWSSR